MNIHRQRITFLLTFFLLNICACTSTLASQKHHAKSQGSQHEVEKTKNKIVSKDDTQKKLAKSASEPLNNELANANLKEINSEPCPSNFHEKSGILVIGDSHAAAETFYSFYDKPPSLIWVPPDQRPGHTNANGSILSRNLKTIRSNCLEADCMLGGFESKTSDQDGAYIYKLKSVGVGEKIESCLLIDREVRSQSDPEVQIKQKRFAYLTSENPLSLKITANSTFYGGLLKTGIDGNPITVIGMNGAKIEDLMNWTKSSPEMLKIINPKYIVLIIGTNEIFDRPYRKELVNAQLNNTLSSLLESLPNAKIVLVSPPPLFKDLLLKRKDKNTKNYKTSHACKSLAMDFEKIEMDFAQIAAKNNLIYFNWRKNTDKCQDFEDGKMENWRPDGVHLTSAGYKLLQKNLFDFLLKETSDEIFKK